MINNDLRDYLVAEGLSNACIFNCPSYDGAIVGYSDSGALIYDFELMVEEFCKENPNSTYDEAVEFINYNTLRTIPYIADNIISPVIMYPLSRVIRVNPDMITEVKK